MKCLESKFEEYIENVKKNNFHKYLNKTLNKYGYDICDLNHTIFYGKKGIGKYSQALNFIKRYSPTELKYERKMNYKYNNKYDYTFKLSDIHFEIDIEMLGCNAKLLYNELFYHILSIFITMQRRNNIIILKNFHKINSDLLDIFYSYMHTLYHNNIKIVYIFLTENISFIPNNILNKCSIISMSKPKNNSLKKLNKNIKFTENIENLKDIKLNLEKKNIGIHSTLIRNIYNNIINYKDIDFINFRDKIYDLFIYNVYIEKALYLIICELVKEKKLNINKINIILNDIYKFLKYYNNNYRPIYHVEWIFLRIVKEINNI